ncbi:hypothetical protein JT55_16825 [Rhodovulum sp. NI22]|nr:hypothetical protein JT55_16825 [Rhodovulum sp. NI22]
MKVAVIGAGAIGANIAYRLAERGAEVVLVDGRAPGSGTSGASFSWLSSFPQLSWPEAEARRRLRLSVNAHFDRLAEEIGGDWLDWCGTLTTQGAVPEFDDAVARCREQGAQIEILSAADLRDVAPELALPEAERVAFELRSGWIDAPAMIGQLLRVFRLSGGRLRLGHDVVALAIGGPGAATVGLADGSRIEADLVVNAGGAQATHIAAMAGLAIPVALVPGVMLYGSGGRTGLPRHVVNGARWLIRPDRAFGTAVHWRGEGLTARHGNNGHDGTAMLADVAQSVPALAGLSPAAHRVGIRAMPQGGPVIGRLPWLPRYYSAVSHGGIGWGPVWAEIAAAEILDGTSEAALDTMRPARFYFETP